MPAPKTTPTCPVCEAFDRITRAEMRMTHPELQSTPVLHALFKIRAEHLTVCRDVVRVAS